MLDFSVQHVGVYKAPEKHIQTVHCPWINFYISGMLSFREYLPDGRFLREGTSCEKPCFSIRVPGMKCEFEFGKNRENWVIMLKDASFRITPEGKCVEVNSRNQWIKIPFLVPVQQEWVEGWQMEMHRIHDAWMHPTPLNSFRARLGVMNILRFMIDGHPDSLGSTPEEKLKSLIDEDRAFSRSLRDMSRSCGICQDHLRVLFHRRFKMSPLEYRIHKRNATMIELVTNSALSVKEISERTGFNHVSHFCMEFKKKYGVTPLEGIRKFRFSSSGK